MTSFKETSAWILFLWALTYVSYYCIHSWLTAERPFSVHRCYAVDGSSVRPHGRCVREVPEMTRLPVMNCAVGKPDSTVSKWGFEVRRLYDNDKRLVQVVACYDTISNWRSVPVPNYKWLAPHVAEAPFFASIVDQTTFVYPHDYLYYWMIYACMFEMVLVYWCALGYFSSEKEKDD